MDPAFGNTLLHWAAMSSHLDMAKLLIEKRADAQVGGRVGDTPADMVA